MRQHFVQFFSPGTFFSETTTKPIESWDTRAAVQMSKDVEERYGARPYGFVFITRIVGDPVPDGEGGTLETQPKEVDRSGNHFITGKLLFYHEVSDEQKTLRSNMRCNNYPICIENRNSYRFTTWFDEKACIVDQDGVVIRRGSDDDLKAYRAEKLAEWKKEREAIGA